MDYLHYINEHFPIRRSKEDKEIFRSYAESEASRLGWRAQVDLLEKKHANVLIGDLSTAQVVFTAHYDTPASSLLPNIMTPRCPLFLYAYHIGYPFALAMISLLAAAGLKAAFSLERGLYIALYLILYSILFYICNRAFTNKHNVNDNTSGVAVVFSLMEQLSNENVAFILFDNEEKGLLGSRACAKKYKQILSHKLIINMDCVGVGSHVLSLARPDAEKVPEYQLFSQCLTDSSGFSVHHYSAKGSHANSDFKNFPCGVGIMTCQQNKLLGYYTGRIHTNRDTVGYTENIQFITSALARFSTALPHTQEDEYVNC